MSGGDKKGAFQVARQDYWFHQGFSFSLIKRFTVQGVNGTLEFIFDPTAFDGEMIEFNAIKFIASGGPFLIDYFVGTIESGDGDPQLIINRNSNSVITPQSTIKTDPTTISNDGLNYFSTLVPGTSQAGDDSSSGLPVEINIASKYMLRLTNQSAQAEDIVVDATFFEVR